MAQATGWSVDYLLWGVNWSTLLMMLADAPRYVKKKRAGQHGARTKGGKRTAQEILECFQTQLKK